MKRNWIAMTAVSALLMGAGACASGGKLVTKVDLLEQELADQRAANRRLESRLDEMQIQLTLMSRKLGLSKGPSRAAVGAADGRSSVPDLKVVKLTPEAPELRLHGDGHSKRRARRRPRTWAERNLPPVEPAEVTERLGVDRQAAAQPLDAPAPKEQEEDGAAVQPQAPSEEVSADFQRAFALYRVNALDRAAVALNRFADRNPRDARSPDALYYAGKARMMLGQMQEAAQHFLKLAENYPKQKRSAEALLLAARCQERLGRTEEARGTYLQLVDAFPLSEQANEANARLKSIR